MRGKLTDLALALAVTLAVTALVLLGSSDVNRPVPANLDSGVSAVPDDQPCHVQGELWYLGHLYLRRPSPWLSAPRGTC